MCTLRPEQKSSVKYTETTCWLSPEVICISTKVLWNFRVVYTQGRISYIQSNTLEGLSNKTKQDLFLECRIVVEHTGMPQAEDSVDLEVSTETIQDKEGGRGGGEQGRRVKKNQLS